MMGASKNVSFLNDARCGPHLFFRCTFSAERIAMTRISIRTFAALLLLGAVGSFGAEPAAPAYKVTDKFALGGEGGWDYLTFDSANKRLYIARNNRVMVVDAEKGKLVGEVPETQGIHGVALVPDINKGFTSNGGDSSVTVFDLKTLKETGRIKVGKKPDALVYDPASGRVFTMNAGDNTASAIDVKTEKVAGTVDLGGKPEAVVSDEKGHIFANIENKNEIVDIDADKLKVVHRWSVAPGTEPAGLAIDRAKRRLFTTCHNEKMIVLDADSGKLLGTPTIGKGTDACVFDADAGLAFSSNGGDGTLTIVKDDGNGKFEVVDNVKTQPGARTMALDQKTHKIYLATAKLKPGEGRRAFEPDSFVVLVVAPGK
jgi:YVTN family beta-propeller protein